jgi:hypothetical protein
MTSLERIDPLNASPLTPIVSQSSNPLDITVQPARTGAGTPEAAPVSPPAAPATPTTPPALPATPQDQVFDLRSLNGQVRGTINTQSITANFNNTVGLYRIDDSLGTVTDPLDSKTYRPGDAGYRTAALRRSQTDGANFSARAGQVDVTLQGGSLYAPYLISNDTLTNALGGGPNVFFNFVDANGDRIDHFVTNSDGRIGVEDTADGGDRDFNDALFSAQFNAAASPLPAAPQDQVFDARSFSGRVKAVINTESITADFNNTVGLYRIEDAEGTVLDPTTSARVKPGEAGYKLAVFRRVQADGINFSARQGRVELELQGGAVYAPVVLANSTLANALSNPGNVNAFFNFVAANPNQLDHFVAASNGRVGVEDIVGGGDGDFNDVVFGVQFEAATAADETQIFDLQSRSGRLNVAVDSQRDPNAIFNNTVGLYRINDAQGSVTDPSSGQTLRPGDAGYSLAAVRRSQTDGITFAPGTDAGNLQLDGGFLYAPYLIANGTVADYLNASRTFNIFFNFVGANSDRFDHFRTLSGGAIGVEDLLGGGDQNFTDATFSLTFQEASTGLPAAPEDQFFDLRSDVGRRVRTIINSRSITADFNNTVGLYPIADSRGSVVDPADGRRYAPGEQGYRVAIVRAAQEQGVTFQANAGDVTAELAGGNVYAPFLISNGTAAEILGGSDTRVFSNFIANNQDRLDHFVWTGTNQFGVEDQINNGDQDFNDALVSVRFEVV